MYSDGTTLACQALQTLFINAAYSSLALRILFSTSAYPLLTFSSTYLNLVVMFAASSGPDPETLNIPPTVGLNIGKVDVRKAKIMFWDLGGQVLINAKTTNAKSENK
jgi:hypothetical protein